jgi:ribosomal protein S18 acetylase RimI-like enzyme
MVLGQGATCVRSEDPVVSCSVVPAGLDRLDALRPLWQALQTHHATVAPQFGPIRSPEESWARGRRRYEAWLRAGEAFVLIAEEDGDAIGYAFVRLGRGSDTWATADHVAELETLAVLPNARGRGVGGALMTAMLAELRHRNVPEWRVGVVASNHGAVRFYERYEVVPTMVFFVGRVPEGQR